MNTQYDEPGLQPLNLPDTPLPGPSAQAGMERAVGPALSAPTVRSIPAWGNAPGFRPKTERGLKARSIFRPHLG